MYWALSNRPAAVPHQKRLSLPSSHQLPINSSSPRHAIFLLGSLSKTFIQWVGQQRCISLSRAKTWLTFSLRDKGISQNVRLPHFYGLREDSDSWQLGVSAACLGFTWPSILPWKQHRFSTLVIHIEGNNNVFSSFFFFFFIVLSSMVSVILGQTLLISW